MECKKIRPKRGVPLGRMCECFIQLLNTKADLSIGNDIFVYYKSITL